MKNFKIEKIEIWYHSDITLFEVKKNLKLACFTLNNINSNIESLNTTYKTFPIKTEVLLCGEIHTEKQSFILVNFIKNETTSNDWGMLVYQQRTKNLKKTETELLELFRQNITNTKNTITNKQKLPYTIDSNFLKDSIVETKIFTHTDGSIAFKITKNRESHWLQFDNLNDFIEAGWKK